MNCFLDIEIFSLVGFGMLVGETNFESLKASTKSLLTVKKPLNPNCLQKTNYKTIMALYINDTYFKNVETGNYSCNTIESQYNPAVASAE